MNSNSNTDKKNICVVYSSLTKKFYFLHYTIHNGVPLYYFTQNENGAIPLPEGYEVVFSKKGHPFLRKKILKL